MNAEITKLLKQAAAMLARVDQPAPGGVSPYYAIGAVQAYLRLAIGDLEYAERQEVGR